MLATLLHRHAFSHTRTTLFNPRTLLATQSFFIGSQSRAMPTKASDNLEDFDNLMLKLKQIDLSDSKNESVQSSAPQVVQQKDDVVYINGTRPEWQYLRPL